MAHVRHPSLRTGRADFPHPALQLVDSLWEYDSPLLGLRLRRLTRAWRSRLLASVDFRLNHLPPLTPLSRAVNMRSVHTLASVPSHCGATSLPCLAFGTPGRLICSCVSLTLPPSCPPWLHGD